LPGTLGYVDPSLVSMARFSHPSAMKDTDCRSDRTLRPMIDQGRPKPLMATRRLGLRTTIG
jgi:hypothetical protein